jgi:hypothetical protein
MSYVLAGFEISEIRGFIIAHGTSNACDRAPVLVRHCFQDLGTYFECAVSIL